MNTLSFFVPVVYEDRRALSFFSCLLEKVDNYFYLGGKKGYLTKDENGEEIVILRQGQSSCLSKIVLFASYITVAIPLLMFVAKVTLRSTRKFCCIDPQKELETGVNISRETTRKINQLMQSILHEQDDKNIEWICRGNSLVFAFRDNPQLVFKTPAPRPLVHIDLLSEKRFQNMIKAKEVCLTHKLFLMTLPNAKKFAINFEGKKYVFIAEKRCDIDTGEGVQKGLYHTLSPQSDETLRQLTIFIAKTGLCDVTPRNIPIIRSPADAKPRSVALIDLEDMHDAEKGICGDRNGNGSCGLIGCLSNQRQMNIVLEEARKQKIFLCQEKVDSVQSTTLREIEVEAELKKFYGKKEIVIGNEPILCDDDFLREMGEEKVKVIYPAVKDPLDGEWKRLEVEISMKEVARDLIVRMNFDLKMNLDLPFFKDPRINRNFSIDLSTYRYVDKEYSYTAPEPGQKGVVQRILEVMQKQELIHHFEIKDTMAEIQA